MKDDDASSKMELDAERLRQLTASCMTSGGNAMMPGAVRHSALELALLQQQEAQFPMHGGAYSSRISDDQLVAAMALAANQDGNSNSLAYSSPVESAHLHPNNTKPNLLQLSTGPTMTSPYAAHLQLAQRSFQIQQVGPETLASEDQAAMLSSPLMASFAQRVLAQQTQEQLVQQQRQLLLQLGSGNMEDNSNLASLSSISNLEILQYLEQKQQDMQAKMLAAAAASKPAPVPSEPNLSTPGPSTSLTTRKESSFPLKLHAILSNPEFQELICWLPNGRSWRILKPAAFERVVIPLVFRHAKYASFMRQVNGWGFKRITGGPASGAAHNSYYHQVRLLRVKRKCVCNFETNLFAFVFIVFRTRLSTIVLANETCGQNTE
jgi:hypothetical protein